MNDAWHLVAHKSEIAAPGDYVVLQWDPLEQLAVMNVAGEIVAFDGRCPHRGANIFAESRGNRPPICGYHGRRAQPKDLRRFHAAWVGDWLFVNRTAFRGTPLADGSAIAEFLLGAPKLRLHSAASYVYDCHWTVAVENALDNEHVPHVHAETLARLGLARTGMHLDRDGSSLEVFKSNQSERMDRIGRFFDEQLPFDYAHTHVHPYAALSSTRGWTWALQNYFPRADGRTQFVSRLFVPTSAASAKMDHFFDRVQALNARVFDEDAAICARVPAGYAGNLGPRDDRIRHFRAREVAP